MARKFRQQILRNDELVGGLRARSYPEFQTSDSAHECGFYQEFENGNSVYLSLSPWDTNAFRCSLIVCSQPVAEALRQVLPAGEPLGILGSGTGVLSVQLLWLRLNEEPNALAAYENDYGLNSHGVSRFFEDLDTVGASFIDAVGSQANLADFLLRISSYPVKTRYGGAPGSVHPHIYAAILFALDGRIEQAKAALDAGLEENRPVDPEIEWQALSFSEYMQTCERLLNSEFWYRCIDNRS